MYVVYVARSMLLSHSLNTLRHIFCIRTVSHVRCKPRIPTAPTYLPGCNAAILDFNNCTDPLPDAVQVGEGPGFLLHRSALRPWLILLVSLLGRVVTVL